MKNNATIFCACSGVEQPDIDYCDKCRPQKSDIGLMIDEINQHMREIVEELASYGEEIWATTKFRHGYKKVNSFLLNKAYNLNKKLKNEKL